jgi:hypothetical protein
VSVFAIKMTHLIAVKLSANIHAHGYIPSDLPRRRRALAARASPDVSRVGKADDFFDQLGRKEAVLVIILTAIYRNSVKPAITASPCSRKGWLVNDRGFVTIASVPCILQALHHEHSTRVKEYEWRFTHPR